MPTSYPTKTTRNHFQNERNRKQPSLSFCYVLEAIKYWGRLACQDNFKKVEKVQLDI